ncbi:hypothetical protein VNO77_19657 [Canavalia gladiata]|uniref:Uncharacterized protein n=1 Tax=Canavalia gladiata TaxID=3824 RepID=A0AAN9QPU2_CANGL
MDSGDNDFIADLSRIIHANARLNVKGWWQFPSFRLFLFSTSVLHVDSIGMDNRFRVFLDVIQFVTCDYKGKPPILACTCMA